MRPYVVLEKELGKTPLETVSSWKAAHDLPATYPASYAGRLDPMATGKLLVILGDECKQQKKYTGLDKEYVVEILLGIGTDTGDVLGIPEAGKDVSSSEGDIRRALAAELGTREHEYPVFSSKTVRGKPLFLYALQGTLSSIRVPTHKETIYRLELLKRQTLPAPELMERVMSMLSRAPVSDEPSKALGADFRIGSIRPAWEQLLGADRTYQILTVRVTSGSGAYMRSLAGRVGASLGTRACALSIKRTRIGTFLSLPFCGWWARTF